MGGVSEGTATAPHTSEVGASTTASNVHMHCRASFTHFDDKVVEWVGITGTVFIEIVGSYD